MNIFENNAHYAITAGFCGAFGSLFGKLSSGFPGYEDIWVLNCICFALMIFFNAAVWTFFVKALQTSSSSLNATVTSAATNYLCSALMGYLFFDETTALLWWCGTFLVLFGLILITSDQTQNVGENQNEKKTN